MPLPRLGFLAHLTTWAAFFFILNLVSVSFSDPRITEAGFFCGQNRASNPSFFPLSNYAKEMQRIGAQVGRTNWGRTQTAQTNVNISIYALAQCYQDLSHLDCLLCYGVTCSTLARCIPSLGARIYLDGCFLRYEAYNFFNESIDPIADTINCTSSVGVASDEEKLTLRNSVAELVINVSAAALTNDGHAVRELNGVYGLAQCWKSLSAEGCKECLAKASKNIQRCVPSREARALNAGCYMRYSTQKFYNDGNTTLSSSSGTQRTGRTVAITSSVAAFCMLSAFTVYAIYSRLKKKEKARKNLGRISSWYDKSNLNFKYEILEKATNYFDPKTKIGQGGAGSVYKGTLPDGKVVAVKRLFFNTGQWVDEFFNEVNLISGIQHKNLVKLLGCSIEGPESLLVFEFVPNKSLEQYLFDNKIKILTWKQRFQIIVGTAQGIAFLHGGSQNRIIHRDIKSSNVLLDANLSPKIADFGLARKFADDKTHLTTGIAGTLGYMAPEYLVKGQLTEKADVYSFGVLVLEMACGRKNTTFLPTSSSLLQSVWALYNENRVWESVDPCLEGDFPIQEAYNVIKVGLLCTQASAPLRPSMDQVIQMLTNLNHNNIPEPKQPPFVNATMLPPDSTGSSYSYSSTRSLLHNVSLKLEESCNSTELSGSNRVQEGGKEMQRSTSSDLFKSMTV